LKESKKKAEDMHADLAQDLRKGIKNLHPSKFAGLAASEEA